MSREFAFKYHGLGNDFVLLDRREGGSDIDEAAARRLCDRRLSIGADGVLVLLPSSRAAARMVVHNADGSLAQMCGNGIRCAAKHLAERSGRPARLDIETAAGVKSCGLSYGAEGREVSQVDVEMGAAQLVAPNLPSGKSGRPFLVQPIEGAIKGSAVSLGNPHLVLLDTPPEEAPRLGPGLERAEGFCERTNVEFCRLGDWRLTLAVWERGVGLTQACGTGACAALAVAAHLGRLPFSEWVPVELPGGTLEVRVGPDLSSVELRGPATFVFETRVEVR